MHRSTFLKQIQFSDSLFDNHGNRFGQIGVKGSGMTEGEEDAYEERFGNDPCGFFGDYHSLLEMSVSNNFADYGGRTSRVLAVLVLNPDRLLDWYVKNQPRYGGFYSLPSMLKRVVKNKDLPALCVRLMGADRFVDYNANKNTTEGMYTQIRMIQRAANLLLCEILGRGENEFFDRYRLDKVYPFPKHLKELAQGQINRDNLRSLIFLQCYFYSYNWGVKDALSKDKYGGMLTYTFTKQDADLAGYIYDWETSIPGPGYSETDAGNGYTSHIDWFMKDVNLPASPPYLEVPKTNLLIGKARDLYRKNFS